jgi:hypothetical protein
MLLEGKRTFFLLVFLGTLLGCSSESIVREVPTATTSAATPRTGFDEFCLGPTIVKWNDECLAFALLTEADFEEIDRFEFLGLRSTTVERSEYVSGKRVMDVDVRALSGLFELPNLRKQGITSPDGCLLEFPLPLLLQESILDTGPVLGSASRVTSSWVFREYVGPGEYILIQVIQERLAVSDLAGIRKQFRCSAWPDQRAQTVWVVEEVSCGEIIADESLCLVMKPTNSVLAETHIGIARRGDLLTVFHRGLVRASGVGSWELETSLKIHNRVSRRLDSILNGRDPNR